MKKYEMKSLIHNGIYVTNYEPKGLIIKISGKEINLSSRAEQMALAMVRRSKSETLSTDSLMYQNFIKEFIKELCSSNPSLRFQKEKWYVKYQEVINTKDLSWLTFRKIKDLMEIDLTNIANWIDNEKKKKENLTKEEKKEARIKRKSEREELRNKYGYAILDGRKIEISNWAAEPPCLFVGRGEHPKRGFWKDGPEEKDITLNLSPDASIPDSFITFNKEYQVELDRMESECKCREKMNCPLKHMQNIKHTTSHITKEEFKMIQNLLIGEKLKLLNGEKQIQPKLENKEEDGIKSIPLKALNIKENTEKPIKERIVFKDIESFLKWVVNVKDVQSPILEFLIFITQILKEKEVMIGEIQQKENICKSCVLNAIDLFTHPNTSPDISYHWKEIVWEPNKTYLAKWEDKLSGKFKYVWFSDSAFLKQEREKSKFSKSKELGQKIDRIQQYIMVNLGNKDPGTRKIATVCWLIFALNMRVGDEKDEEEADTVGAITLRPEHIRLDDGILHFDFLGKDSVRWIKHIKAPPEIIKNIKEFSENCKEYLFEGIKSKDVTKFLSEQMKGLTSKVFRTWKCTSEVKEYLASEDIKKSDPDYIKKFHAKMANLTGAIVCNHKRKVPSSYEERLTRKRMSLLLEHEKLKTAIKQGKKTEGIKKQLEKKRLDFELYRETKEYTLGTSLKNYIDPIVFTDWAKKIDFDLCSFYPKSLQKKFSWALGCLKDDKKKTK